MDWKDEVTIMKKTWVTERIVDMLTINDKVIALEKGWSNMRLVEVSDKGIEGRVICREKLPPMAWGASATADGEIIVTSTEGLIQVNMNGDVKTINDKEHGLIGNYHACRLASDNNVYAIRTIYWHEPVYVDVISDSKVIKQLKTSLMWDGWPLTCEVDANAENIYICSSYIGCCIFQVNLEGGRVVNTYGRGGCGVAGQFNWPRLCTRINDDLVVADHRNHRLQLFNTKTKSFHAVNASNKVMLPSCATLATPDIMLVSGNDKTIKHLYIIKK